MVESACCPFAVIFHRDPRLSEVRLSSAEHHVAWLVCDGLSNRDIAVERGTAERTVANQIASIFHKLGVCRRFDVAQFLLGLA
jgi:two-component system, NarL family, response regulator DevR